MKIKIAFLFALFFHCGFSQLDDPDIIIWGDSVKLVWKDFKQIEPTKGLKGEAGTTVKFHYKDTCIDGRISVWVYAWFSKSKSWVVKGSQSKEGLLEHEQLHFDIIELYVRRCRMGIAFSQKDCTQFNYDELLKIIKQNSKMAEDANELYDEESDHYRNKAKQKEWEEKIKKELKMHEGYKLPFRWW